MQDKDAEDIIEGDTVALSAVSNYNFGLIPKELAPSKIFELVGAYIEGGRRSEKTGFDGVQIFCSHGYLISQFLSPFINKRTDERGGSFENRASCRNIYLH